MKFTYKHFLVVDPSGESLYAANASECANEQGKFWEYHDKLVAEAITGRSQFNPTNLKKYATELGLDANKFNACVDTLKFASAIQADIAEGTRMGINSTPSFFVNGSPLRARSLEFSEFARVFDSISK